MNTDTTNQDSVSHRDETHSASQREQTGKPTPQSTNALAYELLSAVLKFCHYYTGNKSAWLGNGQARKSLNEFQAILQRYGISEENQKNKQ